MPYRDMRVWLWLRLRVFGQYLRGAYSECCHGELNGGSSSFPPLAISSPPFFQSLSVLRMRKYSCSKGFFCSKSHFPSSKVQPAKVLFLRPGTLHEDRLSILPLLRVSHRRVGKAPFILVAFFSTTRVV